MPRYHFNLTDGITFADKEGEELPDLDAARIYANKMAYELRQGKLPKPRSSWSHWKITVTDESELSVYEVKFSDAKL